jgi:DtxR family Mn-dependent transcriptional regulator
MNSTAVEYYLKAIYDLGATEAASTSAIADRLGLAAGSVTGMLKRLSDQGLVEHMPYHGARLTAAGARQAVDLIRRHRNVEMLLVTVLGCTWDRVHDEAERLEHVVSDELIERMAAVLGSPKVDPHGAPIPAVGETFVERKYPSLNDIAVGSSAVLRRVRDEDPEVLRYLAELQLVPGVEVTVAERGPFNGPLFLEIGDHMHIVSTDVASSLFVEPTETKNPTRAIKNVEPRRVRIRGTDA